MTAFQPNPFSVQTPEAMSAEEATALFVDVLTNTFHIEERRHTFINGHRGSGKSMMLRLMEPDCLLLRSKAGAIRELPYFAIYATVKSELNVSEFHRVADGFESSIMNEHALVIFLATKTFHTLAQRIGESPEHQQEFLRFARESVINKLERLGVSISCHIEDSASFSQIALSLKSLFNSLYVELMIHLKKLVLRKSTAEFENMPVGYFDFFLPMIEELQALSFMPNQPIFIMLDDADNLSAPQTRLLNGWVSTRTTKTLCWKISTQLNYKTYRTPTGTLIEHPHDYSEINIAAVFTSPKGNYLELIRRIVENRLTRIRDDGDLKPENFFPPDENQESKIAAIASDLKAKWDAGEGRGNRARDDAYRYARPEYIRLLSGARKQGSTYVYAGFNQLANISSGIIRNFLEPASKMYSEVASADSTKNVDSIPPSVQNDVIRLESANFALSNLDKLAMDASDGLHEDGTDTGDDMRRMSNLINVLGAMFRKILLAEGRAERRVFSILLSQEADSVVKRVLALAVQHGYLQETTLGTKEGYGRTRLFILSRRLAPFFSLDPTGFSGYQSMSNDKLRLAMDNPTLVKRSKLSEWVGERASADSQASLFPTGGESDD